LEDALDLYESFYYIHRQPTWGEFPASCVCLGCCKWTICEHTALLTSLFRTDVSVPDNLVAETPALRKKCSKVRGTAGPRRARLLQQIAKQKKASTSKLAYVSEPVPPVPDPDPPVPDPVRSESRKGSPPPAPRFIEPSPKLLSLDEVMNTFPCDGFVLASADSLVRQDAPAPIAAAEPNRRQAIAAPSTKKVYLQSHAWFT
jgi:hypothetical protein